jgi:antitoxin ParD1/3/4
MLREERAVYEEKLAILKREVQRGIDQIEAGQFSDLTLPEIWERRKSKHSGS